MAGDVGGVMAELKLYRPGNGSEGSVFEARYCDRCVHDQFNDCEIHTAALCFGEDDPDYPREWVYDEDGTPTCTKFATEMPPPSLSELEEAGQTRLIA
jgi:hypothetical protein